MIQFVDGVGDVVIDIGESVLYGSEGATGTGLIPEADIGQGTTDNPDNTHCGEGEEDDTAGYPLTLTPSGLGVVILTPTLSPTPTPTHTQPHHWHDNDKQRPHGCQNGIPYQVPHPDCPLVGQGGGYFIGLGEINAQGRLQGWERVRLEDTAQECVGDGVQRVQNEAVRL